ncbi:hypothetical protein KIN20_000514 [Parelaphostrongylus tenuis]|uniref:Uncharacterized protein n=1 Tax=Parelaphostrongylus tenuis TaxID=148309 RepID=A0AAD5LSM3_PARTN|nr:hypothetical protein KIN20_000514 [Parelaphostrongylus tenuis]
MEASAKGTLSKTYTVADIKGAKKRSGSLVIALRFDTAKCWINFAGMNKPFISLGTENWHQTRLGTASSLQSTKDGAPACIEDLIELKYDCLQISRRIVHLAFYGVHAEQRKFLVNMRTHTQHP